MRSQDDDGEDKKCKILLRLSDVFDIIVAVGKLQLNLFVGGIVGQRSVVVVMSRKLSGVAASTFSVQDS